MLAESVTAAIAPGAARRATSSGPRLIDIYRRAFQVVRADTPELLEAVQRLRYQIYCVENSFEDPADHPGGLERDRFDDHSAHCLLQHQPSGIYVGTVRLILPLLEAPTRSFSVQHACDDPIVSDPRRFPIARTAEISRICISRQRRLATGADASVMQHAFTGLAQASVLMSIEHGIIHWFGLMEPVFVKRVAHLGIHFEKVGQPVEYHGKRQPVSANLVQLLDTLYGLRPDVWDVMTDEGRLLPDGYYSQLRQIFSKRAGGLARGRGIGVSGPRYLVAAE